MDYLATIWDAGGSAPPELALVRKLTERGHRVVVLAGPPLRPAVEAAGASFRAWREVPHRRSPQDPDPFTDADLSSPPQLIGRLVDRILAGPSAAYAREVGAALDECGSDVLVSSMLMLGGMAAAEARRVPCAVTMPNCYAMAAPGVPPFGTPWLPARTPLGRLRDAAVNTLATKLWDRGLAPLNATRTDLGLPPLRHVFDQHTRVARILVLSSAVFDFPTELPANVRYVGPQLDDPVWVEPVELPPGDEPLVLVGMSSTFMNQGDLLRRVVAALDTLPVRGLVTTGPEIDPAEVPGTGRVRVVTAAPHRELLPHCAAVVSHGGHGTVIKAAAAGVPQLVIPLGRDQPNNGARVVAAGIGVRLKPSAKPTAIAAAVRRLLDDPSFTQRSRHLAERITRDAHSTAAVTELENLARPADDHART
ncbi:glycosyltransferase [Pseudonocardia halophobica]|uniref:N-glycosyltransferase n=1 Tax=Pseudonocardia halophobica TaxID=29401 RepID=A0A9W6L4N9_9PSEU|nr:glycosyltransferase [Pseudonocardia halophobica]GLL13606.1 N-glycosyltransferase [Pseudonocardia halophobica]